MGKRIENDNLSEIKKEKDAILETLDKDKDTNSHKSQYQKMLNNLLGISNHDNAIFTKSRSVNYDLNKFLLTPEYENIFKTRSFKVELAATKMDEVIKALDEIDNVDEFLHEIDNLAIRITMMDRKKLIKNFAANKSLFLKRLTKFSLKTIISQWKKFRSKYIDIQYQTNVWPLYVSTCFIRVATKDFAINAPLFLKKVELEVINDRKVFISSIDENVEINEKLLFVLKNDFDLEIPDLTKDGEYSFDEIVSEYKKILKDTLSNRPNLRGAFEFTTQNRIANTNFRYVSGMTLSIISPSGGSLRKRFTHFIKNEENIETILQPKPNKVKQEVISDMRKQKGIFRITETDASQEIAIMGALKDHAIIWGPPGTGKSQTICNIIANLLYRRKITVVTSEKKAALDVIKNRMGKLAKFIFFGLVSKNMMKEDKKLFYEPFADLAAAIDNKDEELPELKPQAYVNSSQVAFSKQKHLLAEENIDDLIGVAKLLYHENKTASRIYHIHETLKNNIDLLREYIKRGNLSQVLKENEIYRNFSNIGFYPRPIRNFIKATRLISNEITLYGLAKIKNIDNVFNIEKFLDNEYDFLNSDQTFDNDTEYLDKLLIKRFQSRVENLRNDPNWVQKIDLFLKHSASGFRMPYKFINMHKDVIERLYDVFISTPQTLAAFTERYEEYDFAIFDEASQMHLEQAIPFISSAQISIIAGDNEQMRPSDFFAIRDRSDEEKIGNSLLDYAYNRDLRSFGREYMLKKNYRSEVGELMLFSSREFYKSKLDVIDNHDKLNFSAIDVHDVDGKWEGRINEIEAYAALDTVLKEYDNYNSIIVLTFNSNQQQYMLKLIFTQDKYKPLIQLLDLGKFKLRNLENIQGDEAELVIVSIAYDANTSLGSTYVTRPSGGNALNVAISRAQKRMIVFKSLFASDIKRVRSKAMAIFKNWLEYLEMSKQQRNNYLKAPTENNEEQQSHRILIKQMQKRLSNALILDPEVEVITNVPIGSYKLDVAIFDRRKNELLLGLEVIAYERGHGFVTMIKNLERRRFLTIKKYPILEITEIQWRLNDEMFIAKIQEKIDQQSVASALNWAKEKRL